MTEKHPCDMGIDFRAGECPDYDSMDCPKTTPGAECGVDMQYAQELIESKYHLLRERGIDPQEIADEPNAEMSGGECENISDPPEGFLCSACGWGDFAEPSHLLTTAKYTGRVEGGPNFCPNCGKPVKR